uniref:Golgin subfamily A member 5 n=1 Tax=Oryctolagus cuniculus TaxID=9986 RepID=A0A5F9DJR4_RABIT
MTSGVVFSVRPPFGLLIRKMSRLRTSEKPERFTWLPGLAPPKPQITSGAGRHSLSQPRGPQRGAAPLWAWPPMLCRPRARRSPPEASYVTRTQAPPPPGLAAGGRGAWPGARPPRPPAPQPESPAEPAVDCCRSGSSEGTLFWGPRRPSTSPGRSNGVPAVYSAVALRGPAAEGLRPRGASTCGAAAPEPAEATSSVDSAPGKQEESSKEDASLAAASADHSAAPSDDSKSHELSNLRLENQLLRNEVQSLNQEMASLLQRSKETQEELNKARAKVEKWNVDHSKSDRVARELRAQVDDLTEAVAAKDSQLAVLKVRLQEADQLLSSRTEALEALQSEKSRIMQDHHEGSSLRNQALQTLQERLHEADAALKREQESYKQMQSEFAARLNKVEVERQNLAEAVMAAERRYADEKKRGDDLQQQVKLHKASVESSKQELMDYKQKATRILQSKEKLINSLKEGSGFEGLDSSTANSMELEELRHEKEMQREEIQKLMGQIHQLRSELQDAEAQQVSEAEAAREQLQELQEQVAAQRASRQELETELDRLKQEFRYVEDDLHRTKNTLQSRIKDREEDIQKLRSQLTNKALSHSSQSELENRLRQLTETLIQKQTMLESLSTEKNALVFQLERLEQQMSVAPGSSSGGSSIHMPGVDSGEGTRLRNVPVLFNDTETNLAGMYGKVRKAASSIDQFSIRLGIFLRRYPVARVFVIIYMALLHLWVMIVLLTYSPEMHHDQPYGK